MANLTNLKKELRLLKQKGAENKEILALEKRIANQEKKNADRRIARKKEQKKLEKDIEKINLSQESIEKRINDSIKAKEGSLTFMVGGNKNEIEYVMPLLNILGDNVLHIGDFGKGMSVKLLNNFIAASSVLATRNVLAQINDFGLTKKQLLDVVKCSTGDNWFAQNYDDLNWSKENFEKTNTMGILEKDLLSYIESKSKNNINSAIDEYENSVVNGIKNIPKVN